MSLLLSLWACGEVPPIDEPALTRACIYELRFSRGALAGEPRLVTYPEGARQTLSPTTDGEFTTQIARRPDALKYQIALGTQTFNDTHNPLTVLLPDGREVSYLEGIDCRKASLALAERGDRPGGVTLVLRVLRGSETRFMDPRTFEVHLDGQLIKGDYARDLQAGVVRLSFDGLTVGKHHLELHAGAALTPFSADFFITSAEDPFRWEDAVIYQVMIDRFAPTTSGFTAEQRGRPPGHRAGGTLSGLVRVLDSGYFERLGVNALWISPLYDNPEDLRVGREGGEPAYVGYHGYWPGASRGVEPEFGTEADVDALVSRAHARGMRVIMDAVLNHVDVTNPLSARPELFSSPGCICGAPDCLWDRDIERCWFTPYLPDVNFATPGALVNQLDDAMYWLHRFDLDGLRLDAVPMMPRLVTRHLAARIERETEGLRERKMLLGETFTGPEGQDTIRWYLGPQGLDGQFDFPLLWALRRAFAAIDGGLSDLATTITESQAAWYGSTAVMGHTLGNHDVTRFATEAGAGATLALRQAFTVLYSLPGMPVLYYGDELGLTGGEDPDNRRPMKFGDELTTEERRRFETVAELGRVRRGSIALRRGDLTIRYADTNVLVFERAHAEQRALVAVNRGPTDAVVSLPLSAEFRAVFGEAKATPSTLSLPGQTASILMNNTPSGSRL